MDSSSWRSYRIMAGDKDIQTQDQKNKIQVSCAAVDDYLDCGYCVCFLEVKELKQNQAKPQKQFANGSHLDLMH